MPTTDNAVMTRDALRASSSGGMPYGTVQVTALLGKCSSRTMTAARAAVVPHQNARHHRSDELPSCRTVVNVCLPYGCAADYQITNS